MSDSSRIPLIILTVSTLVGIILLLLDSSGPKKISCAETCEYWRTDGVVGCAIVEGTFTDEHFCFCRIPGSGETILRFEGTPVINTGQLAFEAQCDVD